MIRRSRSPGRPTAALALLAVLWLSGCASQGGSIKGSETNPVDAYTRLGVAYLERDNLPRAMKALDRALSIDPSDAEALQAMAMLYQRQGESALADKTFQKALDANPSLTRARNNYAAFLYDQGRTREACDQLERAARDTQYENRAQLFANLGKCQRELGNIEAARESLERAQAIDPRESSSYLALAELELEQGHLSRARTQLDAYIRLAGRRVEALRLARDIAMAENDSADDTREGRRNAP